MEEPPPPLLPPLLPTPPPPPPSTSPTTVTTAPFPPPPVAPPVAVTAWLTAATDAAARSCAAAGHAPCAGSTPWGGTRGVCDGGIGGSSGCGAAVGSGSSGGPPTPFHGVAPPGVGVGAYVERLGEYGGVAPETWVLAVVYLSRSTRWGVDGRRVGGAAPPASLSGAGPEPPPLHRLPAAAPEVPLNGLTVHRLVLAALVLAAKTHEDAHLSNGGWAVVGGVGVAELNGLELGLLAGLGYATAVRAAEYEAARRALGLCAPRGAEKEMGGEWRHDLPAPAAPAPAAPPAGSLCWAPLFRDARPASPAAAAAAAPPRPPSPAGGWSPAPVVWSATPIAAYGGSPAAWVIRGPATPPPGALPGWGLPGTGGPIHSHAPPPGTYAGSICQLPRPVAIPAVSAAPPLPPSWSAAHRQRPPRCGRTSPAFRKPAGGGVGGTRPVSIGR